MASKQATVDYILDQAAGAGSVSARKMFGEYGLYCAGVFIGLVCDDRLFVKPTPAGRALIGDEVREGTPYPGAKPHLLIPAESWDDAERLTALFKITASELPSPRAKHRRHGCAG